MMSATASSSEEERLYLAVDPIDSSQAILSKNRYH